jgi:hypothetical protein
MFSRRWRADAFGWRLDLRVEDRWLKVRRYGWVLAGHLKVNKCAESRP